MDRGRTPLIWDQKVKDQGQFDLLVFALYLPITFDLYYMYACSVHRGGFLLIFGSQAQRSRSEIKVT